MNPREKRELELRSWRKIAEFLHVSVRTAQLWEKMSGLPIHRLSGKTRGTVFAYTDELTRWLLEKDRLKNDEPVPSEEVATRPDDRSTGFHSSRELPIRLILLVSLGVSLLWITVFVLYEVF